MIHAFLLNLFLAVVYVMLTVEGGVVDFFVGFAAGYVVLSVSSLATGTRNYGHKVIKLFRFGLYFMYILTKANLEIAWEIITPGMHQTPRILRYNVEHLNDVELTTLANCITLTPGTLVVDVSEDAKWLYIHCMYAKEPNKAIAGLKELDERLQREVFS